MLAPAKLTWYLEVTGQRADGYHELRSEMTTLGLSDELDIDPEGDSLRIVGGPPLPLDETNLIARALRVLGRRAGVVLTKRIPVGGGLGGGSADAGAILRWGGGVDDLVALQLGGDVPFCQRGGRALVTGVGEFIEPLEPLVRDVTLFLPPFSVSTPAVYRAYDELVAAGERPGGRNHLEAPARLVEPRLEVVMAWAKTIFGPVHLAGSGSTFFLEGHVQAGLSTWNVESPVGTVQVVQTQTTPEGRR